MSFFQDENPREAMLKHAEDAAKNPRYINAYQKNQPINILTPRVSLTSTLLSFQKLNRSTFVSRRYISQF